MFDPVRICQILNEEGVAYVIVGGFASVVHGSSLPTQDIDVVPSRERDDLDRLGRALRRMNAMIRTGGDPVAAHIAGPSLANRPVMLNLVTDLGDEDLTFVPSGGFVAGGLVRVAGEAPERGSGSPKRCRLQSDREAAGVG